MTFKLALRNVRRRALTYIVYLVTVVLTAALMLASNGVLFAHELMEYVHVIYSAIIVMTRFVTVVVAAAVCFIICHATTWMLGRRRREFGTYMLLGVPRKKVVALFAAENAVVCVVSLLLGGALGIGLFYVFNAIVCSAIDGMTPLGFTPICPIVTVIEWLAIFLIAIAWSSRTLKKAKISELIREESKRKKYTPRIDKAVSVTGGVVFGVAVAILLILLCVCLTSGNGDAGPAVATGMVVCVLAAIAGVFVFYIGLRGLPLTKILARRPGARKTDSGADAFAYKDVAYDAVTLVSCRSRARTMNSNAVLTAVVAVLMTIAIMLACFMFGFRYALLESVHRGNFDISIMVSAGLNITEDDIVKEAEKYAEVKDVVAFSLYFDEDLTAYSARVISESDANDDLEYCGEPTIDVEPGSYILLSRFYEAPQPIDTLTVFGEELTYAETVSFYSNDTALTICVNYLVVDDAFTEREEVAAARTSTYVNMNVNGFLPPEFQEAVEREGARIDNNVFKNIYERNAVLSAAVIASLFLGTTCTLLSMALLSLRITADAAEDRRRYAILYALGMNRKQQRRMLRSEILKFFALPLILPLISVIPTLCACAVVCDFVASLHVGVFVMGIGVPLIYVAILAGYFGVTYFISLKTVLGAKAA